jgi:hypothetical protein
MRGAPRAAVVGALNDLDAQASEHGGFVCFSVGSDGTAAHSSDLSDYEDAIGDLGFIRMAPVEGSALTLALGEDRYLVPLEVPGRGLQGLPGLRSLTESRDEFLALKAFDEEHLIPALVSLEVDEEVVSLRFPDRTYFISAAGWHRAVAESNRL